eukprot:NODE_55_length_29507_cov_0.809712.p18 type:complete len:223 gc:universal NODE_55_length_29507_cov_0.809712:16721-16053(-)
MAMTPTSTMDANFNICFSSVPRKNQFLFIFHNMEQTIGLVGKDCCVIATDTHAQRSILVLKDTHDRIVKLTDHTVLAYGGEPGDCGQFIDYVQKNIELYSIRYDELTPNACAHYVKQQLAEGLRSRPYQVNCVIGGFDKVGKLYWIDYLGSIQELPFCAQGYSQYFCMSTMDKYYKKDMSKEECVDVVKKCIHELKTRFTINLKNWQCQVITADGITNVKLQ